jgi:hypothetical protein
MTVRRETELRELSKRVTAGRYQVDPVAVADAILRRGRASSVFVCGPPADNRCRARRPQSPE